VSLRSLSAHVGTSNRKGCTVISLRAADLALKQEECLIESVFVQYVPLEKRELFIKN